MMVLKRLYPAARWKGCRRLELHLRSEAESNQPACHLGRLNRARVPRHRDRDGDSYFAKIASIVKMAPHRPAVSP